MGLAGKTMRDRNVGFESMLRARGLLEHFVQRVLRRPEAGLLADLDPRLFHEQTFKNSGSRRTDEHDAYASHYERMRSGRNPKEPVARLLTLLYVVRNNLEHGQKVLSEDFPEMTKRNLAVLNLAAPLQRSMVKTLFETLWADGLFAYGTLRPSSCRFSLVEDLVERVEGEYFVCGKSYDRGTYPGLVLGDGDRIPGEVLRSSRLHELLARTDDIEGADFKRRLSWARPSSPERELALVWIYEFASDTSRLTRYTGGT